MQEQPELHGGWQQKQLFSKTKWDLKIPRTLEPILPAVCEKNRLRFIRLSDSGNRTYQDWLGKQ